jgi:small conductance mechanosensitive channel
MVNVEELMSMAQGFVVTYGMKLVGAVITLVIGLWIVNQIVSRVGKMMVKSNVDPSLVPFLKSLLNMGLKVSVVITAASVASIEMTSFVAILGAAGLAVGLALQGTLQNFAGGVIILLLKPFKVGDFIDATGYMGTVKSIQIFHTILNTGDNKTIIIPNGPLANSSMTNFSTLPTRRVDFSFGIGYNDDFQKAKGIIKDIIAADSRIKKDPAPFVRVGELADSSVNITTRVWVDASEYWNVHFDMIETVKTKFDEAGINIPFPQMDVHVHNS